MTPTLFISYARADKAFALKLADALKANGYDVLIDTRHLPTLEDWRCELLGLIALADTMVFVISPRSIASDVCEWEVAQMARMKKRLAPVILKRVPDDRIPADLARINYLSFDPPHDFAERLAALCRALQTDMPWWHEHTRVVRLAERWNADGRPEGQLLRIGSIIEVQNWISRRPADARLPEVVGEFLMASSRKEDLDRAELLKREQRISESFQRLVTEMAKGAVEGSNYESAMRLCIAGEPTRDELARDIRPSLRRRAMLAGAAFQTRALRNARMRKGLSGAAFLSDAARVVLAYPDRLLLWDLRDDEQVVVMSSGQPARTRRKMWPHQRGFAVSDDRVLIACSFGRGIQVVDLLSGECLGPVVDDREITCFVWQRDSHVLLLGGKDGRVYSAEGTFKRARPLCRPFKDEIHVLAGAPDGDGVLVASGETACLWSRVDKQERYRQDCMGEFVSSSSKVMCAEFSSDSRLVMFGSQNFEAYVVDVKRGRLRQTLQGHGHYVTHCRFSSSGRYAATASASGRVRIWIIKNRGKWSGRQIEMLGSVTNALQFSTDERLLMSAAGSVVALTDTWTGERLLGFHDHAGEVRDADFDPEGSRVLAMTDGGSVCLWDTAPDNCVLRVENKKEVSYDGYSSSWVPKFSFSDDFSTVILSTERSGVRVFDLRTGEEGRSIDVDALKSRLLSQGGGDSAS